MSSLLSTRLSAASNFLLQSPPGEINDVFTDLRSIVSNDQALEESILPALRQYNTEQYVVSPLKREAGKKGGKVIVTPVSNLSPSSSDRERETEKHVSWRDRITFDFNHMNATATNPAPIPSSSLYDEETLSILDSIDPLFSKHVENHYNDGVCAIYPLVDERYPQPEPEPSIPSPPPPPEQEGEHEEEEVGTLAQDLPREKEESAQVAAETSEAAQEAIKEGVEDVPVDSTEEEQEVEEGEPKEVPMDIGTPAQPTETEPEPEPSTKEETERPLKSSRLFGLYLVGNKYNPTNYWTGRWRSNYVVDYETGKIEGKAEINIHYYEQGNVQLSTTLTSSTRVSPSPSPESIIASLKQSEQSFSTSLSSTYSELSEDTFKGLRRALPKTRSKIDWNKAGGYRLGAELGGSN
ncbi:hypothetical protein JCM16303_002521 [Sporobolomyces ruberrimus]